MATTVYDINVKYNLDDKASKALGGIGRSAEQSAKGIGVLSRGFGMLRNMAMGGFGIMAAKKHLIDYNSEMDKSKIAMAGMIQMNFEGVGFNRAMAESRGLMKGLQADAAASVGTTKDFVEMSQLLLGPLTRAGGSMTDLREITKGAVIASGAFGMQAETAARDIEQALAGTLGQKDRFARALLEPMGLTTSKFNEMMKKTPDLARAKLKEAFTQPAIQNMAKKYEQSWEGVTSTLEDNFQRLLGEVGKPLMQELTKEMMTWTKWLDKNQDKLKAFAKDAAGALVSGFKMMKSAVQLLVDNKTTVKWLMIAAMGWKGMKGLWLGGKAIMGGLQVAQGHINTFAKVLGTSSSKLTGFAGALGIAIAGITIGFKKLFDGLERRTSIKERSAHIGGLAKASRERSISMTPKQTKMMATRGRYALQELREEKMLSKDGKSINKEKLAKFMTGTGMSGMSEKGALGFEQGVVRPLENLLRSGLKQERRNLVENGGNMLNQMMLAAMKAAQGEGPMVPKKPANNINVKVNKIQVSSDDPDRIAFGLVGAFQELASNATQSRRIMPGSREG